MTGRVPPRGRDTAMIWAIVAWLCVSPALYGWLREASAASLAVFGRPASSVVLVTALLVTSGGAVTAVVAWYGVQDWSRGARWRIAGPVAALAVAVVVLGVGDLAAARTNTDLVLGALLLIGAAAMAGVAVQVLRVRATNRREYLRSRIEQLRKERL
jgi:hypothetical protein